MSRKTNSVLVCEPMAPLGLKLLSEHQDLVVDVKIGLSRNELLHVVSDYDALLVRSATKVDAELINAAPRLKLIGRAGVGIDNIDTNAAKAKNIAVINTPSGNSISAAELAFGLMLCLSRKIPAAHHHVQSNLWDRKQFQGTELYGKTLGIIGFGNVGQNLALRAQAFAMRVVCHDPWIDPSIFCARGVLPSSLHDVFAQADFLSLHCALSDDTRTIINERTVKIMKRGAMIINTARGELIDDKALLLALDTGHLHMAALDVFRKEPPEAQDPLIHHPKIIVTPHLGASTEEAQLRVSTLLAEQTIAFFAGVAVTRVV